MKVELTRNEIIRNIVAQEQEPDQVYCPTLKLYWEYKKNGTTGVMYWDSQSGHRTILKSNVDNDREILRTPAKIVFAPYYKYHEKYGVLEIALISIEGNRGKEGETRNWTWNSHYNNYINLPRLFLFKDSVVIYNNEGKEWKPEQMGRYYNKAFVEYMKNMVCYYNVKIGGREIAKFTGRDYYSQNNSYSYDWYNWNFINYYKKMAERPNSKLKRQIDNLSDYITTPISKYCDLVPVKEEIHNYSWGLRRSHITKLIVFEPIEIDGVYNGVFRIIVRDDLNSHQQENGRIFIDAKGKPTIMSKTGNQWMITSSKVDNVIGWGGYLTYGFDQIDKIKNIKYIKSIIENVDEGKELQSIVNILRHPIVEMAWKSGYQQIAKSLMREGKIAHNLKELYNTTEKKGKFYDVMGLNKYQLKYINDNITIGNYYTDGLNLDSGFLELAKFLSGVDNLKDLSEESTKKCFDYATLILNATRRWKCDFFYDVDEDGETRVRNYWSYRNYDLTEVNRINLLKVMKLCRRGKDNDNAILRLYLDVIRSYARLSNEFRPNIDIYDIDNIEHLYNIHEQLIILQTAQTEQTRVRLNAENEKKNVEREKKMAKLQEKRVEKFEYSNDRYSIIVPKRLADITFEGSALRHCVGSYLERVASGDTNILFLRKNDAIDTPFFTIEVANDDHIVQIHGFGNRWLGNVAGIRDHIQFVIDWLKEKGISCRKDILLNCSESYGRGSVLIDEKLFSW